MEDDKKCELGHLKKFHSNKMQLKKKGFIILHIPLLNPLFFQYNILNLFIYSKYWITLILWKSKHEAKTLKVKPKIKCNTFWRCIFYAHVMKLPKLTPCSLLSSLFYFILFKFSHSNLFHVNIICNKWPWKNLYSFFWNPNYEWTQHLRFI